MNNTLTDFYLKLEDLKYVYPCSQNFHQRDHGFYKKEVEKYLISSSQEEFNFTTLLEINILFVSNNCGLIKNPLRFLTKILMEYHKRHMSPLMLDFETKFTSFNTYNSAKGFTDNGLYLFKRYCKYDVSILAMFDSAIYDSDSCSKAVVLIEKLINQDLLEKSKGRKLQRILNGVLEHSITGTVATMYRAGPKHFPILGSFKPEINNYLYVRENIDLIIHSTISNTRTSLERFAKYLGDAGLTDWEELNSTYILNFIETLKFLTAETLKCSLSHVRGFLKYLYQNKILNIDLSLIVPRNNYHRYAHLPSIYSPEEIKILLNSINRMSNKGKRDYCIILIAARYGLRGGDICKLQFSNIDWDKDEINLIQNKTGVRIIHPLLEDVGNAIINYLEVRPKIKSSYIFLRMIPPYDHIKIATFSSIVSDCLMDSKIKVGNRKRGVHILRHSLSAKLIEQGTPLNTISDILGHKSVETTFKYYISIDLNSLKKCSLEVDFNLEDINEEELAEKEV